MRSVSDTVAVVGESSAIAAGEMLPTIFLTSKSVRRVVIASASCLRAEYAGRDEDGKAAQRSHPH
jgi:hypothetical protein